MFNWLFKKKQTIRKVISSTQEIENVLSEYYVFLNETKEQQKYVSKKVVFQIKEAYKDFYQKIITLNNSHMLKEFAKKYNINLQRLLLFLRDYDDLEQIIDKYNKSLIESQLVTERKYLDDILKESDSSIKLDNEQREVVLSGEDYTLVVAGAGAGKTTTVAAKVKYLVEKQGIRPEEILIISFTNKAVDELKERINKQLKIEAIITTFHKTGLAIIKKDDSESIKVATEGLLYRVIEKFLSDDVFSKKDLLERLILFFGSYFDESYGGTNVVERLNSIAKGDFSTIKSNLNEINRQMIDRRTKKMISIKQEELRSYEEVEIANFLYLNGIDYVYEPVYKYAMPSSVKAYQPDFYISQGVNEAYIEHFGITENGKHSFYSHEELTRYLRAIQDKRRIHKQHGTVLIETYSKYNDGKDRITHLKKSLSENGFLLNKVSSEEVYIKLMKTEDNRYVARLIRLLMKFIANFKVNDFKVNDFDRLHDESNNVRTRLFLTIAKEIYIHYQWILKQNHALDFEDMINKSAQILREKEEMKEQIFFKYVIVDEYQDISQQRFNLTKALAHVCDAKIMAVGDDWQSIYAFSGSNITLFTEFKNSVGYAKELKIQYTYRNSQELIDIAGGFVQKNSAQIKKQLKSPKTLPNPVVIQSHNDDYKSNGGVSGINQKKGEEINKILREIVESKKQNEYKILLIGRYNFDAERLGQTSFFTYNSDTGELKALEFPKVKIDFLTAHSSKGLGYDEVIIINAIDSIYGFPAQIEVDPIFNLVIKQDRNIDFAEERRLFYVALTRTKNKVYIVVPENKPSSFVMELIEEYNNVTVRGQISKTPNKFKLKNACPICGFPLQLKENPHVGMKLWICTNEPEICDFISNDYISGEKMSIHKCNQCRDGFLIVKKSNSGHFLGCTNYQRDGKGCNNTISKHQYYASSGYLIEEQLQKMMFNTEK